MNILLVEDDLVNQKIASQLLSKWGMEVTIAQDGMEAIELMRKKTFNIILMDLNMPVMDGCEATMIIRSDNDPYFKNVPILAYTSSSLADTKEKAEKLGMNDFISKPLNAPELHCKINQYMITHTDEARPIKINFELYTDSDEVFKSDLVSLMVDNLRELQCASYKAYYSGDTRLFNTISHKVMSTLLLLDDRHFTYTIDDLKEAFTFGEKPPDIRQKINTFNRFSELIIKSLNQEINALRAAN